MMLSTDSGDVPGMHVLSFGLVSTIPLGQRAPFNFDKIYENHNEKTRCLLLGLRPVAC